jgi:hypothetical protein
MSMMENDISQVKQIFNGMSKHARQPASGQPKFGKRLGLIWAKKIFVFCANQYPKNCFLFFNPNSWYFTSICAIPA